MVHPKGGVINQPPVHIKSPLMTDIIELLSRCEQFKISQKQKNKIIQTLKNNPDAVDSKAIQYRNMDNYFR
jgi:hypothetical protein